MNTDSILTIFRELKFLAQIQYFAKAIAHGNAIAFGKWPIFSIVSFLEYLVFSRAVFLHNFSNVNTDSILTSFREVKFLAQIDYFAKAIAHAKVIAFPRWPIFNSVSSLKYLVSFEVFFFLHRITPM